MNKIHIKYEFTDEIGNSFNSESNINLNEYDSVLMELSSSFNTFLQQIGFTYFDKEYILMKSLDEKEYEILEDYLEQVRTESKTEIKKDNIK